MKIKILLLYTGVLLFGSLNAQSLDRISISSGGNNTNEMSYVIGETFCLSLENNDFSLDFGSQGGTDFTGGTNTSVKSFESINSFECYPNPAADFINFTIKMDKTGEVQVKVFDLTSRLIMTKNFQSNELMQLNISNLCNGSYLLILYSNDGEIIGASKFIKSTK